MPIQIRCRHFIPPFLLWKSLQGPGISGVRSSLLAILWQDRVRIFSNPVWLVEEFQANLTFGVLQVDHEDPADDLGQDLYEV